MIREIRIGELGKLEDAAREFYSASRFLGEFSLDRFCEIWAHLLNSGAGVIFADERGENGTRELAGVIGGIVHPEIYGRELVAEEFFWFVRAEHRGAGVRLYRRFEEWARERGAARLQMVHLFDSMPEKVAKFYLHSGFEPVEMRYQKTLAKPAPGIQVFDDFLPDPDAWRAQALALEYKSYTFGETTFHGIALPPSGEVPLRITERFPRATPTLSFFRRSPAGQVEPHFIHTDIDMGEWSAILYLNPEPPAGDGTAFWEHIATGERENPIPHMRSAEGYEPNGAIWRPWRTVPARFNRLLMFPSSYFHSRAIYGNWGAGDDARLTQVVFGRGEL